MIMKMNTHIHCELSTSLDTLKLRRLLAKT